MGFFSKITKPFKKVGGLAGAALGAPFGAAAAIGGAVVGSGGLNKLFKGGPSPDEAEIEQARVLRRSALGGLQQQLDTAGKGLSPQDQASLAIQQGQRSISDTERLGLRNIQQNVARRGIAGLTSAGLGAGAQLQADLGRQRASLAASSPLLQEQARQAQRQEIQSAISAALGSGFLPEFAGKKKSPFQKIASPLFGAAGAGIGGLIGGGAGAKAGGSIGLGVGKAFG